MTDTVTIQIERSLVEEVKLIASVKWKVRNINKYAEAVREVMIDFVKKNKKIIRNEENNNNALKTETEA